MQHQDRLQPQAEVAMPMASSKRARVKTSSKSGLMCCAKPQKAAGRVGRQHPSSVVEFLEAATRRLREVGGLQAEGIFRKPGSTVVVGGIKAQLLAGASPATVLQSSSDPFVLANVLTQFLKAHGEGAGPLIQVQAWDDLLQRVSERASSVIPRDLPTLITRSDIAGLARSLSMEQQAALGVLVRFLQAVCAEPATRMQYANLGTMMVGALLNRDLSEFSGDIGAMQVQMETDGACVAALIRVYPAEALPITVTTAGQPAKKQPNEQACGPIAQATRQAGPQVVPRRDYPSDRPPPQPPREPVEGTEESDDSAASSSPTRDFESPRPEERYGFRASSDEDDVASDDSSEDERVAEALRAGMAESPHGGPSAPNFAMERWMAAQNETASTVGVESETGIGLGDNSSFSVGATTFSTLSTMPSPTGSPDRACPGSPSPAIPASAQGLAMPGHRAPAVMPSRDYPKVGTPEAVAAAREVAAVDDSESDDGAWGELPSVDVSDSDAGLCAAMGSQLGSAIKKNRQSFGSSTNAEDEAIRRRVSMTRKFTQLKDEIGSKSQGEPGPPSTGLFRCIAPAGVTPEFDVIGSSGRPTILMKHEIGTVLTILEVRTAGGRTRGRTDEGWVSFVSGNEQPLLARVHESHARTPRAGSGGAEEEDEEMAEPFLADFVVPTEKTDPSRSAESRMSDVSEVSVSDVTEQQLGSMKQTEPAAEDSDLSATGKALASIAGILAQDDTSEQGLGSKPQPQPGPVSVPEPEPAPESAPSQSVSWPAALPSQPAKVKLAVAVAVVRTASTLSQRSGRLRRPGIQAAVILPRSGKRRSPAPARPVRGAPSGVRPPRSSNSPAMPNRDMARDTHITRHLSGHRLKDNADKDYWSKTHRKLRLQAEKNAELSVFADSAVGRIAGRTRSGGGRGGEQSGARLAPTRTAKPR